MNTADSGSCTFSRLNHGEEHKLWSAVHTWRMDLFAARENDDQSSWTGLAARLSASFSCSRCELFYVAGLHSAHGWDDDLIKLHSRGTCPKYPVCQHFPRRVRSFTASPTRSVPLEPAPEAVSNLEGNATRTFP